jgi:hypothetical protein
MPGPPDSDQLAHRVNDFFDIGVADPKDRRPSPIRLVDPLPGRNRLMPGPSPHRQSP